MFILECDCGNEVFCNEEDTTLAWQCDACGQWYDLFGSRIAPPDVPRPQREYYYEPGEDEDD